MKRKITVVAGSSIRIVASIDIKQFTVLEIDVLRDALADRLQAAAADLPYHRFPRNRVVVR